MQDALEEILGAAVTSNITIAQTHDGSALGAAFVAAAVDFQKQNGN